MFPKNKDDWQEGSYCGDTTSIGQASIGQVSIGQASVGQVRHLVKYVSSSSSKRMRRFVKYKKALTWALAYNVQPSTASLGLTCW